MNRTTAQILTIAAAAALASPAARAGVARVFELAGFDELDKGEPRDTRISSRGEVSLGERAVAIDTGEVGLVFCAARSPAGAAYLGTGYDGKILRVDGGRAVEIAKTGQLVVTAIAFDGEGALYAAALPEAIIWKIEQPEKIAAGAPVDAVKWAALPAEAKHVWALVYDREKKVLYAGTGPSGQIYAIGRDAKPAVYLDTEEEHVLSLLALGGGRLVAGTSPGALVLEVSGPGRSTARADFDATEVRALATLGDAIVAAVNKFSAPPPLPSKPTAPPASGTAPTSTPGTSKSAVRLGDGAVVVLRPSGQEERIFERAKAHINALAVDGAGAVYAGLAADGKVVSVDEGRVVHTALDVEKRQVLCLLAGKSGLELVGTADSGAAYAVQPARAAEAMYFTPAFDAESKARFGAVEWFADGALSVRARCGNTLTPDASWSDWSADLANRGRAPCGPSRYLQLRFSWTRDPKAVLRSVEIAYQQANLRAVVTELNPDSPFFAAGKGKPAGDAAGPQPTTRAVAMRPAAKNPQKLDIEWKVDNPDKDDLRFRLYYRAVGEKLWRPILRDDEVLTKTKYSWVTESVPEGRYEVRLVADDSPSNDPRDALSDERISVPVLVDNHQPEVRGLKVTAGQVRGEAVDGFSAVAGLEMSVDGGPWWPLRSDDGLFDESREAFAAPLPEGLAAGPHAVAVRAYDRAGNMGAAELHFETK